MHRPLGSALRLRDLRGLPVEAGCKRAGPEVAQPYGILRINDVMHSSAKCVRQELRKHVTRAQTAHEGGGRDVMSLDAASRPSA